jgi:hypothetical protein
MDPTNGIIALKGTTTVYSGHKIVSSDGNSIQFGNGIAVTGSIISTVTPLVSGSSQISYTGLSNIPSGIISSSTQLPSGIVSSSLQVTGYGFSTTGSNVFVGSQVITGSLYITTDLVVQGCSSLQNITASAVSIGTNTVMLNTATPAVRFAGVSVQDSGSNAGVTGSIFWDGLCNRWIYSNPSNVGYSGGMLLSGPRNTGTIGNESTLTCNYLAKSGGGDHLYDSCIIDDGTTTCIKNNLMAGIGNFSGCLTFGDWTTAANVLTSNKPNEQGAYIRAAVSTATYPTYTFQDDRCTGMYRDSANSLGFATSGSARITISPVGLVGIGTNAPSKKLHICGTGSEITFDVDNANLAVIRGNVTTNFDLNNEGGGCVRLYGSQIQFRTNTADPAAIITNNGSFVSVGACCSRICLDREYSGVPSNVGLLITDTNVCNTFNHNANGGGTYIGGVTCVGSNFCVAGSSYFANNIRIGTTSNLTSGAYSSIRLGTIANWWAGNSVGSGDFYLQGNSYYDGSSLKYIRTDAATEYSQVSGFHAWSTAASGTAGCSITMVERMRISNTGLVGIGTINPDYNLVICCSGQVIANVRTNSTTAGSESGILITTPDSIGLLTVGASSGRGVNDAARCDMVMGLRTGGKIRFTTDVNANITQVSIANGITSFTCQMCAPYAIFSGTAAITLPVGTTGQRPGPSTGMIRFNSTCTELEYYNGNDWLFFTSTPQSQGYYADVLVVAGGGGGGGAEASNGYGGGGAGGGAGGYAAGRIFINYTNCGYPISIGAGGTGGANNPQATGSGCNGTMGTASCALGLIAIGGGFGGGDETGTNAGNGGSGGGQGGDNTGTQGCGTLGQGCAGGYANTRNGGGGGGASTTGCHGYGGTGAGGQGRAWYNGTTYAGGGGGGNGAAVNTTTSGGAGGGGNGSATDGTSGNQVAGGTATAGTANTGGGGGGGAAGRAQGGQNGGSGIVIVRYYGSQKGFGGTITSSGGYTYHSFTSSGTYCATYY